MTYRLWIRSLIAALIGHLTAFLLMALFSWLALYLENPSSAVLPIAFVAMGAGAVTCAIAIRKSGARLMGALMGGGCFVLILFVSALFGKGEFFTLGTRLLLMLLAFATILTVVLLFGANKKKKRRRKGVPMRRK